MPRLPTFTANIQPGAIAGGRRAGPEDLAADITPVGRALQQGGDVLLATELGRRQEAEQQRREAERLRLQQEAKAERDGAIRRAEVTSRGTNEFLTYINDLGQKPISEVPDVVTKFNADFDTFRDKALANETDPNTQRMLAIDLDRMRNGLLDNTMRMQAQRAGIAAQSAVKSVFEQNEIIVQKDPAQLERLLREESRLIDQLNFPGLTPAQTEQLRKERQFVLPGAALTARMNMVTDSRSAKALKNELETNKRWQELLSGEQYGRALNAVNKDIRQFEGAERAARREVVQDRVMERAAGIPNGLSEREAGGDPRLLEAIRRANNMGKAREEIRSMPFTDLMATLKTANEQLMTPGGFRGDSAYLEAVMQAANERNRALREDPAGYAVQNHSAARKAYDAMVQANFAPETVRRYSTAVVEAQRELGGPAFTPRALPKALVDQTVADINNLPPEQAANRMEALRQQFGPMWGQVLGEMHGRINPGYATVGRLTAPSDALPRAELVGALRAGPDLRKNLSEVDVKTADAKIDSAMAPYLRVASQAGFGAQAVVREELAAARALAYSYVAKGVSPNDAARRAADTLIYNRYDMGETFSAPKGMLGSAQREANRIMRATPASAFMPAADESGLLSEGYRQEANRSQAMRGFWANVTDSATGKMGIEWRSAQGEPVILKSGERVRLFFDDLKALPPAAPRGALSGRTTETPGGAAVRTR